MTDPENFREVTATVKHGPHPSNVVDLDLVRRRRAYNEWNARVQIGPRDSGGNDDNAA